MTIILLDSSYHRHSPNGKKRRVSSKDNQLSESSQLPAYISALKSLQNLSGLDFFWFLILFLFATFYLFNSRPRLNFFLRSYLLLGQELQQVLRNFNLEWNKLSSHEMKRVILTHLGFGQSLEDLKNCDNAWIVSCIPGRRLGILLPTYCLQKAPRNRKG